MKPIFQFLLRVWRSGTFSPTAFVTRAVLITLLFCVSELLGFRDYTSFLSGTTGNAEMTWQTSATLGLIHLLLYVAFVLCVPIFLIAAGLISLWNRLTTKPSEMPQAVAADIGSAPPTPSFK